MKGVADRTPWSTGGIVSATNGWGRGPTRWRVGGVFAEGRVSDFGFDVFENLEPENVLEFLHGFKSRVNRKSDDPRARKNPYEKISLPGW